MTTAKFETVYRGVRVTLNFKAGFGINGAKVGQLITSNEFVQDAVENDPRFGTVFHLKREYQDDQEQSVDNYELRQVAEKPRQKTNAQVFAENQAKIAKKKQEQKKSEVKKKPEAEPVDNVKSINDAVSFFADRGDLLKDPADIPALCAKHAVTFPNLKTDN